MDSHKEHYLVSRIKVSIYYKNFHSKHYYNHHKKVYITFLNVINDCKSVLSKRKKKRTRKNKKRKMAFSYVRDKIFTIITRIVNTSIEFHRNFLLLNILYKSRRSQ